MASRLLLWEGITCAIQISALRALQRMRKSCYTIIKLSIMKKYKLSAIDSIVNYNIIRAAQQNARTFDRSTSFNGFLRDVALDYAFVMAPISRSIAACRILPPQRTLATLGARLDVLPIARPLLSPSERPAASGTGLLRKVGFCIARFLHGLEPVARTRAVKRHVERAPHRPYDGGTCQHAMTSR
ncbi:hypothetical protein C8J34_103112 [Rhizobium sp. PP-F2F-G36]|nr:hypothetical protein C8J34_103112 [Rhizobium sp. PP-F2F-G36]